MFKYYQKGKYCTVTGIMREIIKSNQDRIAPTRDDPGVSKKSNYRWR